MPTDPIPDDQPQASESASAPVATNSTDSSSSYHAITGIAATGLFISFFLPWIRLLGDQLNGMAIQRHFSSYRFVWVLPLLAIIALVVNVSKLPTRAVNLIAGFSPFAILLYAAYHLRENVTDLFKVLQFGAWLALIFGAVLVFAPCNSGNPPPPSDYV